MYPDRPLQACLHKGWTVYKKTQGARWRSVNFFQLLQGPLRRGEWGMAEPQSPPARRVGNGGASIPQRQRGGNAGGDQGGHNPCITSPKPMRTRISVPHTYNVLIGENSQYNKNTNCFFTPLRGILMFVSS